MLRNDRHEKLLQIIKEQEIETQEELCAALSACGFDVTQATVSRDIRGLHLYKVKGTQKRFRYTVPEQETASVPETLLSLFRNCVVEIRTVGNMIVTKTLSGNGGNAGGVIDGLNYSEVVGTIAGDDTVFSVCETPEKAKAVVSRLEEIIQK